MTEENIQKTDRYIPDNEEVDLLMEDWLGTMRQQGSFVHKNIVDAMTRELRKDESVSEYVFGNLDGLEPLELAKRARGVAQMTVDTMSPERINVRIGGPGSYTDGKAVNIASDVLDRKDLKTGQKVDILIGYAAHEASHILHTDFDRMKKEMMKSPPEEKEIRSTISNIIDDERIEMLTGDEMPGMADYFAAAKKYSYDTMSKENKASGNEPKEELPKFMNNLLAAIRYPAILERQDVIDNYDHLKKIKNVLTPYPMTDDDVYKATDKVVGIMKDLIKKELQNERQPQSGQQQENQPQQENRDPSGQSGQQNLQQRPQQGQTDRQPSKEPTKKEIEDAFKKAVGSDEMKKELQKLEKELNRSNSNGNDEKTCDAAKNSEKAEYINDEAEIAGTASGNGDIYYTRKRKGNESNYRISLDRVKRFVPAVRKALACKAQESEYALNGMPSGKMNGNKLVSLRTGNTNIFTRVGNITTSGACVCILIDESGSMNTAKRNAARDAAILINEAIKGIPNLETFVYGFTTRQLNVYCEKRSTDRWGIGSTKSQGGTPTGDAMRFAAERVRKFSKSNCLMFIVTDGMPDDQAKVQRQDELLRKKGFVPVGIGIDNSVRVNSLFKEAFAISDLSELAPKLGHITKKYMDKLIVMNDSMDM